MKQINVNRNDYESFNDYNDFMVQAFNIGCSLCGSNEIEFILKGHPVPVGTAIKNINTKDESLIEKTLDNLIDQWQDFDDKNSDKNIPTYLCSECWNSFE